MEYNFYSHSKKRSRPFGPTPLYKVTKENIVPLAVPFSHIKVTPMSNEMIKLEVKGNPKLLLTLERIRPDLPRHRYQLTVTSSDPQRKLEIVNWPADIDSKWKSGACPFFKPLKRLINVHLSNHLDGGSLQQPTKDRLNYMEMNFDVDSTILVSKEKERKFLEAVSGLFS